MTDKIRILIVDDSAFMRKSLSIILSSDPDIEIIGTARDGLEGVEMAKKLLPDIITLDIEMPRMDGLSALKIIMQEAPTSVIMVSSLTSEGADATIKALELGAVDFIPKELSFVSVNIVNIKEDLIRKVKTIHRQKALNFRLKKIQSFSYRSVEQNFTRPFSSNLPRLPYRAIALGVSTGGPLSLQRVIPLITENLRIPFFIVQHMPPKFTKSLADRLNGMSLVEVKEAEDQEPVRSGVVYIAPGGHHLCLARSGFSGSGTIKITDEPSDTLHRPSVDVMMNSVIDFYGKNTLGVIMTGMGRDGSVALKRLKELGGVCLAQDEESSVVYGMPKSVVDLGCASLVAPLDRIAEIINRAI